MAGADAQAGFYYQNLWAAEYALRLIDFGSSLKSVTFENPSRGKHVDDIIATSVDSVLYVQVKWSQDDGSAFTLHNLVTAEEDSTSLLAKLARGFRHVGGTDGRYEIALLSTRKAGTNRQPASGFSKSLTEFIEEFHQPFIEASAITDLKDATSFNEYESIVERLRLEAGLADLAEMSRFLKCFRFQLSEVDSDTMGERIRGHLSRLGIERTQYATLLDAVVKWSLTGHDVNREDVLRVLGLLDRFVDRVGHYFPVNRDAFVPMPVLFNSLDASIGALDSGFVLVEGEAGSGKSTALSVYLSERPDIRFGYYCFVPNDRAIGNERLGGDAFVRSLCIGLRNAFPDVKFPDSYAPHTVRLLNEWLRTLSAKNRRVVFVVDGLDHVDRKTRQSLVAQPLTAVLDGEGLPANILIVLSARYPEALPPALREHVRSDPKRHIQMPTFDGGQVREFLRLRSVGVSDRLVNAVLEASSGVPIYLEYLADRLTGMTDYEQKRYLESVPTLRDKKIDGYHRHLWEACSRDDRSVYILAFLAARDEFTSPETLRELLESVGVGSTLKAVHDALTELRHVLRVSDARGVAIRHSSLAEFVIEQTAQLGSEISQAMVDWYEQHPDADEAWRHRLRHLFDAGKFKEVLRACDDEWLTRSWVSHRPMHEMQHNLDIAWQSACAERDILEFVRIALMKQRVALVAGNLERSEAQFAALLLEMGRPDDALRRVWDGHRRSCSVGEFAEFCLHQFALTGRMPPRHIVDAGLGDGPDEGASLEAIEIWYRVRSHAGNPVRLLQHIDKIRWTSRNVHRHLYSRVADEDARLMNLGVQMAVLRELVERSDLEALNLVRGSKSVSEALRSAASAALGIAFARVGEVSEASAELRNSDLSSLPEAYQSWVLMQLAPRGLDVLPRVAIPSRSLPSSLMRHDGMELSSRTFGLYDELRVRFLEDSTAFPWFEASISGLTSPAKGVVSAIGQLAQLWTSSVRAPSTMGARLAKFKTVISDLDVQSGAFAPLGTGVELAESLYRREAPRLFEQAWCCGVLALSAEELQELALWWARSQGGARARRYPEATRTLATAVYSRLNGTAAAAVRELLELAEASARTDEEAAALAAALMACASAWGRCAFTQEATRLWRELLDVGCGVGWRKDYQFNEILTALKLAHEQDASGTVPRVKEQLALAHQLIGTARSRTTAIAIEELIAFVAGVDPRLALEALVHEEDSVYRERAVHGVVVALLQHNGMDRRQLLALVGTMRRWRNYTEFDEETQPAAFAVYVDAIGKNDIDTARYAYDFWRGVFLLDMDKPAHVGRWASAWVDAGTAPPDVTRDRDDYLERPAETSGEPPAASTPAEVEQLAAELDVLSSRGDLHELETRLDALLAVEMQVVRRRELDRAFHDWRDALGKAAERNWADEESELIEKCFALYVDKAIDVPSSTGREARHTITQGLQEFVRAVANTIGCEISFERFEAAFDVEAWLDEFVRSGTSTYLDPVLRRGWLPAWIASAPLGNMAAWEEFCRRRCSDGTKADGLIALAKRRANTSPGSAIANLTEAWESVREFFHEDVVRAKQICAMLLELDPEKGCDLLLGSFRMQYQRYPSSIIYRLDNILSFAKALPSFDAVRLYKVWSEHNRRLGIGLSEKTNIADFAWVVATPELDLQQTCMEYIVSMLSHPIVDVRLMAADELFRLLREREFLVGTLLSGWSSIDDCQKEHVVTVLLSLGIARPALAGSWVSSLVGLVSKECHYSLRAMVADTVALLVARGMDLPSDVLRAAKMLKAPPTILLARPQPLRMGTARVLPRFLAFASRVLSPIAPPGALEACAQTTLSTNPSLSIEREMEVHRRYNINTNFDTIEIAGEFDRAVRSALNRAVWTLLESHLVDTSALLNTEDVLRLRDPTDILVQRVSQPAEVSWLDPSLSDDEFIKFADIDRCQAAYREPGGDWVTVFEYTEQRAGDRHGGDSPRAHKITLGAFMSPAALGAPTQANVAAETARGCLAPFHNRYRFELVSQASRASVAGVSPLVAVSLREFRGRPLPTLAALAPEIADEFGLVPDGVDPFGYRSDGAVVVRSVEWQAAFDQGRRLHEPRSVGFLLQARRSFLVRLVEARRQSLWLALDAKRTVDRYEPELRMTWHPYSSLFQVHL